jgi:ureidoglycolate amidohydrolase
VDARLAGLQVTVKIEIISQDPPATCAGSVQDALRAAAERVVSVDSVMSLVSRAYHDSTFMAQIAPTGMLFIPCAHGYSHRPDEFAAPEDMADGIRVLALALAQLAECPMADGGAEAREEL